jgi:hypothetical protein
MVMTRLYHYVGPAEIKARIGQSRGVRVSSIEDLLDWIHGTDQRPGFDDLFASTFVIDTGGGLWIADRRSEHVTCAGGEPVLSACEMFFFIEGDRVEVIEVSNQSTGYCPEPESWPSVADALELISTGHPGRFTQAVIFRRCALCAERNIVKDDAFICGVCGADLPKEWNLG